MTFLKNEQRKRHVYYTCVSTQNEQEREKERDREKEKERQIERRETDFA